MLIKQHYPSVEDAFLAIRHFKNSNDLSEKMLRKLHMSEDHVEDVRKLLGYATENRQSAIPHSAEQYVSILEGTGEWFLSQRECKEEGQNIFIAFRVLATHLKVHMMSGKLAA